MRRLYFILTFLFSFTCNAQIIQAHSMQEVFPYLKDADANTLVIFDIDMVLTQPSNPAFQIANMHKYRHIVKRFKENFSNEQRFLFFSLALINSESILVDHSTITLLQALKENNIPSIALTAGLTGPLLHIENMVDHKIESLYKFGIDFSAHAPYKQNIVFTDLPKFLNNHSIYSKGVLFSNGPTISKGEALLSFLKRSEFQPRKIIFIDDRHDNLKSVEQALRTLNLPVAYHGIWFLGANNHNSIELTEQQFENTWTDLANNVQAIMSKLPIEG